MNKERIKILDKAKKIKELADRGFKGEQTAAKDTLEKYMAKHNITIDEINGHTPINSIYGKMSDEQFMKEMVAELVALGIGVIFSKLFKVEFNGAKHFNDFSNKYTQAVKDRTKT